MEDNLQHCITQRDSASQKLQQWTALLGNIQTLQEKKDNDQHDILVNLGEEFYLQGRTHENKDMFVNAGLGFLVPMQIHSKQITTFVQKHIDEWNREREYCQRRAEEAKNVILLGHYVDSATASSTL